MIDKSAIVSHCAKIGKNVGIGPYAYIMDNVEIGDGTQIGAHAVIASGVRIGKNCRIFHHAVIGEVPQDLKFEGEETVVEVGDNTTIREFVTINRGTKATGKTIVGSNCFLMAYVHVAHDCRVGDNSILANAVNLGGHVEMDDWVVIGGLVGVHQFVKIGKHSFIGGGFRVTKDVPPYVLAAGEPLRFEGLNVVGLRRRGFSSEQIKKIKDAYKVIYNTNLNVLDAVKKLEKDPSDEVKTIIEFIKSSSRGIIR
ncbi:MAG: acyl-ACP--UDP-N-acetylglucosamine O-acyltransferase [Candidatus Marinimicrobia bacterium]|nr:acyl-ACP--UDP-N-acetylglucosamine O-acyltransferase [Candidatus Neomarinimicrobiota bacterium]